MKKTLFTIALTIISIVTVAAPINNTTSTSATTTKNDNATSELWITSGKQKIYGVLSKPEKGATKQPIVIISHGFNGTHEYGKNYFKTFNDLGYQCFTFDFPCGSIYSRSDNNTQNMSVIDEQQSLEAVVSYFQQQPDIDPNQVILLGESQGGLISALVAANKTMNINKLILVFPALCIPDNWNERYKQIKDIPDSTSLWNVPLGRRFFTEIRYLKPFDVIGQYEGPVLIVHGDSDKVVPFQYSERAKEVYENAQLFLLVGAGHGFKPKEFERELSIVVPFLKK